MPTLMSAPKIGSRGGRIITPPTQRQPPPEMVRELKSENSIQAGRVPNAVESWNEQNLELEQLKATVDSFSSVILKPKSIKAGDQVLFRRLVNIHFQQRLSIELGSGLRSDCIAIACCEPFFRLAGYATETREIFITEFTPLIELLDEYESENGQSLEPLRELCECDRGRCHEVRPEPIKQPTVQDLIAGLTNALKANKPAAT